MAFDKDNWARQTDAGNTGQVTVDSTVYGAPAIFSYRSAADNSATIAGANYFADAVYDLSVDDLIMAQGSDTFQVLSVATLDRAAGTITTSSTGIASSVGTSNLVDGAVTNAKLGDDTVHATTVTVTSAELLALATTPKELVAAPGADIFIEFVGAKFILDYATTQYTEAGDNLGIKYTDASGVQVSETVEMTGFIDQAADTVTNAVPIKDAIVAASGCVNQALVLDNLGSNFAAGDSDMYVQVLYREVTAGL
jgi:hypothetical protein